MICKPCGANDDGCTHRLLVGGRPCCPACRHLWAARIADPALPLWLRVVAYAETHADAFGRCALRPHELHHGVDQTRAKENISRAIKAAVKMGWLEPGSGARRLVLVRGAMTPAGVHTPEVSRG